jgi:membrane protease YdiL (CAAX protease family)
MTGPFAPISRPDDRPRPRDAWTALALIVPAQSIGVGAMLLALPGPAGLGINILSRLWMLAFPILWTLRVERRRPRLQRPTRRGMALGIASGVVVALVMWGAYVIVADGIDLERLRDRAGRTGFDRPLAFAAMFGFIILLNSLLEEYVWRWFVVRQAEAVLPGRLGERSRGTLAAVVAAALFTIHHVVALTASGRSSGRRSSRTTGRSGRHMRAT